MNALLVIVTIFSAIGLLFTVGIYKMDGTLLYEVIAAMDYEYCNGYKSLHDFCVREGVDINNSVQQRSNHKLFQHEN